MGKASFGKWVSPKSSIRQIVCPRGALYSIQYIHSITLKEDTTSFEGFVQGSYTLSPMLKLNCGIGYAMDKNDSFKRDDTRLAAFVNAPVSLGKGFTVVPEFTYIDQLDQAYDVAGKNIKGDKQYIAGAKWQMDF